MLSFLQHSTPPWKDNAAFVRAVVNGWTLIIRLQMTPFGAAAVESRGNSQIGPWRGAGGAVRSNNTTTDFRKVTAVKKMHLKISFEL